MQGDVGWGVLIGIILQLVLPALQPLREASRLAKFIF